MPKSKSGAQGVALQSTVVFSILLKDGHRFHGLPQIGTQNP
jgi:hypothetical protein